MIMTQENKKLLLRDLCTRLPYGVKVQMADGAIEELLNVNVNTFICNGLKGLPKPYLHPLSSMTEEQKLEIKSLCDGTDIFDDGGGMSYISILGSFNFEINLAVGDWYNKNHFDYRGLIPMGLAIDATGLNIY